MIKPMIESSKMHNTGENGFPLVPSSIALIVCPFSLESICFTAHINSIGGLVLVHKRSINGSNAMEGLVVCFAPRKGCLNSHRYFLVFAAGGIVSA